LSPVVITAITPPTGLQHRLTLRRPMPLPPDPATTLLLPLTRHPRNRSRRNGNILPALPVPGISGHPGILPVTGLPDGRHRTHRRWRHKLRHRRRWRHRSHRHDCRRCRLNDDLSLRGRRRPTARSKTHRSRSQNWQRNNKAHLLLHHIEKTDGDVSKQAACPESKTGDQARRPSPVRINCASGHQPRHTHRSAAATNDPAPKPRQPAEPARIGLPARPMQCRSRPNAQPANSLSAPAAAACSQPAAAVARSVQ
jgi:hypothetical protein